MICHIGYLRRWKNTAGGQKGQSLAIWDITGKMIERAKKLAEIFKKYDVEYLFIGNFGAILYGYPVVILGQPRI